MNSIRIVTTKNDFRLFISPSQKERAKKIYPREWSPNDKCWIYPKNNEIFNALVHEFGREAFSISENNHHNTSSAQVVNKKGTDVANNYKYNADIHSAISMLNEKELELQSEKNKNEALINRIKQLEWRIEKLNDEWQIHTKRYEELLQYEIENQRLTKTISEKNAKIDLLKQEIAQLKEIHTIDPNDSRKALKEIAEQGPGGLNVFFIRHILSITYNDLFCIEVAKKLDHSLRKATGTNDNLMSLIQTSEKLGILSPEAADYAHTIRRQGNFIRHYNVDKKTYPLRNAYVFIAAALLWPIIHRYDE